MDQQCIEVEALITASYREIRNYHFEQLSGMAKAEALFLIAEVNEIPAST